MLHSMSETVESSASFCGSVGLDGCLITLTPEEKGLSFLTTYSYDLRTSNAGF